MPKSKKDKFYAVRKGRGGLRIYDSWDECKEATSRFPGAIFKSFLSRQEAQDWLNQLDYVYVTKPPASQKNANIKPCPCEPSLPESSRISSTHKRDNVVQLSTEQANIMDRIRAGQNVFFTGSAGTGKSVLLREIIKLWSSQPPGSLAVTATTGVAALNLGNGQTIHSWSGIGMGRLAIEKLKWKVARNSDHSERWRGVNCIILDEISMLDASLFDILEEIARFVRGDPRPFGGIQLIISGDFLQLPPVPDRDNKTVIQAIFAFDATSWDKCLGPPMLLTKVFRQKDQEFASFLESIRMGNVSKAIEAKFKELARPVLYEDGIGPTELYPTKDEAFRANKSHLDLISSKSHSYKSHDTCGVDDQGERITVSERKRILEKLIAPETIELKVGARVMLIKNTVQGKLVNGSTGIVISFMSVAEAANARRTILDLRTHDDVVRQKNDAIPALVKRNSASVWPYVRFTNGSEMLCIPQEFNQENRNGEMEASRLQVPLILAWAISVHKSQGQTLERVKIDLARTFEKGQAYVALSRATSLETLEVYNFRADRITAHPHVLRWMSAHAGLAPSMEKEEYDYDAFMDEDEAIANYHQGLPLSQAN